MAFVGKWFAPIYPRTDVEILSFIGAPLSLPLIPDPSPADIDCWHAKYVAALTSLFGKSRVEVGEPDARLEIW